jgi:flagellar biosynthesis protein FlhF
MKLKSYFSGTVEAAVELARKELGEDALLVNARPATPETRHLGAYEVVFSAPTVSAGAVSVVAAAPDRLTQDIAEMRREIERLARTLGGARMFTHPPDSNQPEIYSRLIANELDAALAQAVAEGAALEDLFEVDATLGRPGAERKVIALAGPPGVGKTTTLIKLAARFGLASRKPAQIITTDVFRIAAADQLRSLASILGIGCDVVETPVALAQALEEHRSKEMVFIDTPGLAACEMEDGADLARFLSTHPEIDMHLVLPASMKPEDMARVVGRYSMFQPAKLLFTRLDETERFGALVNQAAQRELPVSFLAFGQQIPDDLEPATKERIRALVLSASPEPWSPGRAAQAAA